MFSVESACHFVCSQEGPSVTTTHDAIGQSEVTWDNPPPQTCSNLFTCGPPRPVQTCSLCSQTSVSKQVVGIRLKCLPCFIRHGRRKQKGKVYKSLNHLYWETKWVNICWRTCAYVIQYALLYLPHIYGKHNTETIRKEKIWCTYTHDFLVWGSRHN